MANKFNDDDIIVLSDSPYQQKKISAYTKENNNKDDDIFITDVIEASDIYILESILDLIIFFLQTPLLNLS